MSDMLSPRGEGVPLPALSPAGAPHRLVQGGAGRVRGQLRGQKNDEQFKRQIAKVKWQMVLRSEQIGNFKPFDFCRLPFAI
jgi:hypothetical protein